MASADENEALVRRFVDDIVNGENYDLAEELFAESYVRHDPTMGEGEGQRGPAAFVAAVEPMRDAFPDLEMTIDHLIATGEEVAFRATERGTHEGEFMGIEPTGTEVEVAGIAMHRIENGKVAETWAVWDVLGLLGQLGVISLDDDLGDLPA